MVLVARSDNGPAMLFRGDSVDCGFVFRLLIVCLNLCVKAIVVWVSGGDLVCVEIAKQS